MSNPVAGSLAQLSRLALTFLTVATPESLTISGGSTDGSYAEAGTYGGRPYYTNGSSYYLAWSGSGWVLYAYSLPGYPASSSSQDVAFPWLATDWSFTITHVAPSAAAVSTTGSGSTLVLSTSPVLVSPTLGDAAASSVTISGALSSDSGRITSDGSGNFTVEGSLTINSGFHSDSGNIFSDGSGVLSTVRLASTTVSLVPQSTAPSSPQAGDCYYNSALHHAYVFDGDIWKQLDN